MLTRTSILALVAAAALGGCMMPEPVLRLTPVSKNIVWNEGRAAQVQQGRQFRAAAAFEREYTSGRQHLVAFRIEIENTSEQLLLVDPAQFYYVACTDARKEQQAKCQPSRGAVNPEQALLDLDIAHSRDQARATNDEVFATTLMFLDLAAATAGAATGKPRAVAAGIAGAGSAAAIATTARADGQNESATYEAARATWSSAALRKTTLPPGRAAAGLVFVDRALGVSQILLAARVSGETMVLPFQQTQFDSREYPHPAGVRAAP